MTEITLPLRPLGSTGIQVSCLGLGTVKFGRNAGVKYPTGFELPDDQAVRRILALSRDCGINLLDTAPAYGSSEERLGKLLEHRQNWVICTKVGEEFQNNQSTYDYSSEHVRKSIERSLRWLRTDYLDIVLIHSDGDDLRILEQTGCLEALEECRQSGLIRAIGMSTKTIEGGRRAVELLDVAMLTCNPQEVADVPSIALASQLGKGILIKKALNSGHAVIGQSEADPVQKNMDFIFSHQGVSAVITGTINPDHLLHNCAAAQAATFAAARRAD
jgi:aryl-alcohol dehydrogenase-like predicted oxidoreductase